MRLAAPSQLGPRDVYGPAEDGGGAHEAEDALLFTGWIDPTLLGVVFIAGQALIVAAFAELQ